MMKKPQPRNDAKPLYGHIQSINRRMSSAVLLLVLGTVMKTVEGVPQSFSHRVVGGQDSVAGRWPWQASLTYFNQPVCGASLISKNWLVTAAHCVVGRDFYNYRVLLGVLNLTDPGPTPVNLKITKIRIHPIFAGDGTSGDLALVELEKPVDYNTYIQPIALPYQNQEFPDGMMCWLTGWGRIKEDVKLGPPFPLQEVQLPLINDSYCDKMFQKAYNLDNPPDYIKNDMICAGYPEGQKDGCQGDSGGPLVGQVDGSWVLVGVVSWGDGCAQPLKPGVYTEVSCFIDWIQENTDYVSVSELNIDTTTAKTSSQTRNKIAYQTLPKGTSQGSASPTVTSSKVINQGSASPISTLFKVTDQGSASGTFTPSTVMDEGVTSAGRSLQISIGLLVVVALSGILGVVWVTFPCL